jgi:hypothetical protein
MTVASVFVSGPYPYTHDYVIRLERMVRKFLPRPFRFVCFTDRPALFRGLLETIHIPHVVPGCPEAIGYWNKLQLFNPHHRLTGRVMFLDLDVLVVNDLTPIADYPASAVFAPDELVTERPAIAQNSIGLTILRRFNASAMAWNAGSLDMLWNDWTPAVTRRLQSDQDWYAERRPDIATMPVSWVPRISRVKPPWPDAAKVVLVKTPKNHIAAQQWPWFAEAWG